MNFLHFLFHENFTFFRKTDRSVSEQKAKNEAKWLPISIQLFFIYNDLKRSIILLWSGCTMIKVLRPRQYLYSSFFFLKGKDLWSYSDPACTIISGLTPKTSPISMQLFFIYNDGQISMIYYDICFRRIYVKWKVPIFTETNAVKHNIGNLPHSATPNRF